MTVPRILVAASEPLTMQILSALLARSSYLSESAWGAEALVKVQRNPMVDLVLLELGDQNGCSLQILERLRLIRPNLTVVVVSACGDSRQVVKAIRLGAQDYLSVPVQRSDLLRVVRRYLSADVREPAIMNPSRSIEEFDEDEDEFFFAATPAMRQVRFQAELLANIDVPVLILGENGTGKEVVARLIHKRSLRSHRGFMKVNCAALTGELLESELFGDQRSSVRTTTPTKQGKLELCNKGTILLDHVTEIPANLQAKLLQVLQDKQFLGVGGETAMDVDVRIMAAANPDVKDAIAERRFTVGLYYRLSAFTLTLPPLRERQGDIPLLLQHLMTRVAAQSSRSAISFSPTLIDACLHYHWPGNITELENFVRRYLLMNDESLALRELESHAVPWSRKARSPRTRETNAISGMNGGHPDEPKTSLKSLVQVVTGQTEKNAIAKTLEQTHWNRKAAARLLKVSYRTLLYKVQRYQMSPPQYAFSPGEPRCRKQVERAASLTLATDHVYQNPNTD
jgi:two-component system, NtrC family, response regulator AtoC